MHFGHSTHKDRTTVFESQFSLLAHSVGTEKQNITEGDSEPLLSCPEEGAACDCGGTYKDL